MNKNSAPPVNGTSTCNLQVVVWSTLLVYGIEKGIRSRVEKERFFELNPGRSNFLTCLDLNYDHSWLSQILLFSSDPSPTSHLVPARTLVIAALSTALPTGASRFVVTVLLSLWNPTITVASVQQWVIYPTNHPRGRRRWCGYAAVVLRPPFVLVMSLYVLGDFVQLLIEFRDAFLHGFHCLGHCEFDIIHNLFKEQKFSFRGHSKKHMQKGNHDAFRENARGSFMSFHIWPNSATVKFHGFLEYL